MIFKKMVWIYILSVFFCVACKDKDAIGEEYSEKVSVQLSPINEPNNLNYINCMELSKDGKILCVGTGLCTKSKPEGYPGSVVVLNVLSHEFLKVIKVHKYPLDLLAFSSDGKKIASCDNHGDIFLTNLEDYKNIPIYTNPQQQQRYCMKFSSDDTILYVTDDHSIIGIDVQNSNVTKKYKLDTPVYSFAFNRNETELIAGHGFAGEDQKLIKVWSTSKKQVIQEFVVAGHIDEEAIYGISVLPDGNSCLIRGAMSVYKLDLHDGKCERLWSTSDDKVSGGELTDMDLASNGEYVAVSGYFVNGIFDLKTKKILFRINEQLNSNTARKIRFIDKSNNLFVGQDSNIYLWKPESKKYELWYDFNTVSHQ